MSQNTSKSPNENSNARFSIPGASAQSAASDFDFLEGKWQVHNRKLQRRLDGCDSWDEFDSVITMVPTLLGQANFERYFAEFNGAAFEGMAVRLFDPTSRLWSIYWIDSNSPRMDTHPVSGSFDARVGKFYALGELSGRPIVVLYQWDARDPERPIWSQAFSADDGLSWEWNWYMHLQRSV